MHRRKASRTALKVAQGVLYLDAHPRHHVVLPDGVGATTTSLLEQVGLWRPFHGRLVHSRRYQRFVDGLLAWKWPGHILYLGLRKRFMETEVREALDDGATQLLVLGGGFDVLALRVARDYPAVSVLEIDHPVSHTAKRAGLEALGALPANLRLIGVDLGSNDLPEVLDRASWDPGARSVVVVEGVLMYLRPADVERLFAQLASVLAPDSRWLFTWITKDDRGRPELGALSGLTRFSLRLTGEPLEWGADEAEIERLATANGFRVAALPRGSDLRRRFLEPLGLGDEPVAELERLAVVCRDGA